MSFVSCQFSEMVGSKQLDNACQKTRCFSKGVFLLFREEERLLSNRNYLWKLLCKMRDLSRAWQVSYGGARADSHITSRGAK